MDNLQTANSKKKVRKFATKTEAIKSISKAINKSMNEKYLKPMLSDSNNR